MSWKKFHAKPADGVAPRDKLERSSNTHFSNRKLIAIIMLIVLVAVSVAVVSPYIIGQSYPPIVEITAYVGATPSFTTPVAVVFPGCPAISAVKYHTIMECAGSWGNGRIPSVGCPDEFQVVSSLNYCTEFLVKPPSYSFATTLPNGNDYSIFIILRSGATGSFTYADCLGTINLSPSAKQSTETLYLSC